MIMASGSHGTSGTAGTNDSTMTEKSAKRGIVNMLKGNRNEMQKGNEGERSGITLIWPGCLVVSRKRNDLLIDSHCDCLVQTRESNYEF
ncbi:hypothetical protein OROMI_019073 [Orobanche minor]